MNDLDRLERLLERRALLLDASTRVLQVTVALGRPLTGREQDAWDYASAKTDDLGGQYDVLAASLAARRYYPRPSFTERVPA